MISIWKFFRVRRPASAATRVELIARGEQFQLSLGEEVFVGSCTLSGYRDEWSELALMADTIRQTNPAGAPALAPEQRQSIAVEAMRLLQAKAGKTVVSVHSKSVLSR